MPAPLPQVDAIFYPASKSYSAPKLTPAELKRTEMSLGVRLPRDYVKLMTQRNGARLRLNGFFPEQRTLKQPSTRKIYKLDRIQGIHSKQFEGIANQALLAREWGVPELVFPLDGDGHWWLCLDYRKCGPRGEPCVTHFDTEWNRGRFISRSFGAFVRGLIRGDEYFIFAITDRALKEETLAKLLRGIGCRRARATTPNVWNWPKYALDAHSAAFLAVWTNIECGSGKHPKFTELPPSRLLLHADVSRKDQTVCIRELAAALGNRATLLHTPPGRRAVRLEKLSPSRQLRQRMISAHEAADAAGGREAVAGG